MILDLLQCQLAQKVNIVQHKFKVTPSQTKEDGRHTHLPSGGQK